MDDLNSIKNKLAHLLNLAAQATNVHEAEVAYKAAQKLMTKHALSEADAVGQGAKQEEIGESSDFYKSHNTSLWKERLANVLAKNNGCFFYTSSGYNADKDRELRFVVSGTETSRELVIYFFHSIVEQSERLCKLHQPKGGGKDWANNFKIGVVQTIAKRLEESKREAAQEFLQEKLLPGDAQIPATEQQVSQALVLISGQADKAEAWVKSKSKIVYKKVAHKSRFLPSALESGRKAGHQVSLHKGLKG